MQCTAIYMSFSRISILKESEAIGLQTLSPGDMAMGGGGGGYVSAHISRFLIYFPEYLQY